jgi:hypothetical protein
LLHDLILPDTTALVGRPCWWAMSVERIDPPYVDGERTALRAWLDYHRATLEWKCEGLDRAGLDARPLSTSLLSLHGLVRHMAEVERHWFRRRLSGEEAPLLYCDDEHEDGDFELAPEGDWAADLATWTAEIDRAREIEAAADSLDVTGTLRAGEPVDLRWIMVHMIEEYARHNGHADLLREMVDGTVGD